MYTRMISPLGWIIIIFIIFLPFVMKRKKRIISPLGWVIIIFIIVLPFAWAIWTGFLTNIVPRHRTLFFSYDSFRDKAGIHASLADQLPQSAQNMKYYWAVTAWFEHVTGYGVSLSDEDYEEMKKARIEDYKEHNIDLYLYSETSEKVWVAEEWLKDHGIENAEHFLLKGERLEDYYVLAYDYIDNDVNIYFACVLCNDSSKRMIELHLRNTYPKRKQFLENRNAG